MKEEGIPAERIDGDAFIGGLNKHLRQVLGIQWDPIRADDPQQLYIASRGNAAFVDRVGRETIRWLRKQPTVQAAFTRAQVAAAVPPRGKSPAALTLAERLNESFDPARSADILVEFRKNDTLGVPKSATDAVAGHGSAWDYDRQVPILFWWPGAEAERRNEAAETVDIAPTLAKAVGLPPPNVDGHCLSTVVVCGGVGSGQH